MTMSNWRRGSAEQHLRNNSRDETLQKQEEDADPLEEYNVVFRKKLQELNGFLEIISNRKDDVVKNVELAKDKINQVAEQIMEKVEKDKKKLLQETDLFSMSTLQELGKTEVELLESIQANEEFLAVVDRLKSSDPLEQTAQLEDLRSRRKKLETVRHDLSTGSLTFKRVEVTKGNLLGEVTLGDIDTSDPYVERPAEVGMIEGEHTVAGVTVLKERIYIIRDFLPNVEVYNVKDLSRHKMMKLEGLRKPSDMASDDNLDVLYISDAVGCVYKLEPEQSVLTKFLADVGGEPHGIYVVPFKANNAGNLLVTCYDNRQMKEYTSGGIIVRSMRFQQDVASPWHVVPILSSWWSGGQNTDVIKKFAVCHGWDSSKLHRICWMDGTGKTLKWFGSSNGSGSAKVDVPTRIAVDAFGYLLVADRNNNRIILLSPNLVYIRDLINKSSGIKQPRRIHLDAATSHLYVGLIDGSVRIFKLLDV